MNFWTILGYFGASVSFLAGAVLVGMAIFGDLPDNQALLYSAAGLSCALVIAPVVGCVAQMASDSPPR